MENTKNTLIEGNIIKAIALFAIPLFFSNLFQQLYNTIDMAIISYYLGDIALATIGSTTAIFDLMVGFGQGIGTGFSIVSARYFGANKLENIKKSVASGIILILISACCMTILFYFGMPYILKALNTPSQIIKEALSYIQIIALFITITLLYNYSAGLLRAIGDSKTPLYVLCVASILNVILDIICITKFSLGVKGAAIATVIAQFFASVLCIIFILKKHRILIPEKNHFHLEKKMILDMCGQGYSMGFMFSIVSIGTVTLQSAINTLGTSIISAHTAARKLFSLLNIPLSTLCAAMSTFVSQNKGAQKYGRIRKGIKQTIYIGIVYACIMSICVYFGAEKLIQMLSNSENTQIIKNGAIYLKINTPFFTVLGVLLILRNALQGLGKKITPLVSSVIELIGKLIFTYILIKPLGYFGVCICEPIIWICMMVQLLYSFYGDENIKNAKHIET